MTQPIEFKPGDIVKLKSGGPEMTVQSQAQSYTSGSPQYWCQWFAGKKLERGSFPADSIEPVKAES